MPRSGSVDVRRCFIAATIFVTLAPALLRAQDPPRTENGAAAATDKAPPPLKFYKGREIADAMHYAGAGWLVRESRERDEECTTMLKALHIKPGQTVCD